MFDRYTSRPWHLYTYSLPWLLMGAVCMAFEWMGTGLLLMLIGLGAGLWIVVTGLWQSHGAYTDTLARNAVLLNKVRDPDVWEALGFEKSPVAVPARIEVHSDVPNSLPRLEFPRPPISDPKLRLFANAVLRGAPMSESYWIQHGFTGPEIRKLKSWMEHPDRKYIVLHNREYPRLGFTYTERGKQFLLHYGDEELKGMFAKSIGQEPSTPQLESGMAAD